MPSDRARAASGSPPHYDLGIDVGNTTVAAAVRHLPAAGVAPEDARAVPLGARRPTVPLVVAVLPDGTVAVGEDAEHHAITCPDRVVRDFRRRIGDPTPLLVAGAGRRAEDLFATVASWVVDRVTEREGGPPDRVVITHPDTWGPGKKALVATAMRAAALSVDLVTEAQAAVAGRPPGSGATRSTVAVYDLGGGTFQASVLRTSASGPSALPEAGGPGVELGRLGGDDFDDAVFDHVRTARPDAFTDLDEADREVRGQLAAVRRDCTAAKETLSSHTEATVTVPADLGGGTVGILRNELEAVIRSHLDRTVSALEQAVTAAGWTAQDLDEVLLVGGSARIPLVARLVSEQLGRPVVVAPDPDTAVAVGAATAASAFAAVPTGDEEQDAGGIEEPTRPTTGRHARHDRPTTIIARPPLRPPVPSRHGTFLDGADPAGVLVPDAGRPVVVDRPSDRPGHGAWIAFGAAAAAALLLGGVVAFSWLGRSAATPIGLSTSAADVTFGTTQAPVTGHADLPVPVTATAPVTASDPSRARAAAAGQGSALPIARLAPTTGPTVTAAPTPSSSAVIATPAVATTRAADRTEPAGGSSTAQKPASMSTPAAATPTGTAA